MRFDKVISLISEIEQQDDFGQPLPIIITKKTVFATLKSVNRTEFYQASTAGYSPKMIFVIRSSEFSNEPKLEFEGKEYRIIRDYSVNNSLFTELTCEAWTA